LRRVLGDDALISTAESIALQPDVVTSDVMRFEALLGDGNREALNEVIDLYRGPLLPDITIPEEAWTEWLDAQRLRLEGLALDALVKLGGQELEAGSYEAALNAGKRAIAVSSLREDAHRLLMRALAAAGRRADALKHYEDLKALLKRELGIDPDEASRALAKELRHPRSNADGSDDTGASRRLSGSSVSAGLIDAQSQDATSLAIVARQMNVGQTEALGNIIAKHGRGARISEVAQSDARTWLVEGVSAIEAAGLAFAVQQASGRMAATGGSVDIRMGAHLSTDNRRSRAELSLALANLANSGRLVASEEVRDQLVDGFDASIEDMGFVQLPTMESHVRAFTVGRPRSRLTRGSPDLVKVRPAIAVLPFKASADVSLGATLGELMAEEIIGALCGSRHLNVISRLSTRQLSRHGIDLEQVWSYLDAQYVISGNVQVDKLEVELINEHGEVKWKQRRSIGLATPAHVREAAEWVASESLAAILVSESDRSTTGPLSNVESYTLLFAAITLMDRWTQSSFQRSRELLGELQERAPFHPLSNAWLSAWHIRSISQGWTRDSAADGRAAIEFAQRSLDADPHCSIALAMDGWANVYAAKRLDIGMDRLSLAVEANPNDSLAWLLKGVTHTFIGEGSKAAEAAELAMRLSPLDPRRSYFESMAAGSQLLNGRYDRAIELASASLRANRLHASTLRTLATAQWHSGRHEDARQTVARIMALDPTFTIERYKRFHPAAGTPVAELAVTALLSAGVPP
jgi:adenylate cyclase